MYGALQFTPDVFNRLHRALQFLSCPLRIVACRPQIDALAGSNGPIDVTL
tara:strand:+ start:884 stop:1033 length:150 start_codon:yes stop_codon:yes gene_type:complete